MWLTCGAMTETVRRRPISSISRSSVASNWRIALPNWKPWVHSVQPRLVYLPLTVKTGEPDDSDQPCSMEWIFAAERSKTRRNLGARVESEEADSRSIMKGQW